MSRKINLPQNPATHPDLFDRIDPSQVVPGDIFRGTRNTAKWYENTDGQSAVDNFRTYWRRKTAGAAEAQATPARPTLEINEVTMDGDEIEFDITLRVGKGSMAELISELIEALGK